MIDQKKKLVIDKNLQLGHCLLEAKLGHEKERAMNKWPPSGIQA